MMFGRELSIPDEAFGVHAINNINEDPPKYVKDLLEAMRRAHETARITLKEAQKRQKQVYDKKLRTNKFEKGDLVYKLNTKIRVGQSTKLQPIYVGPYLVVKVLSPVLYQIEGNKSKMVLHHDRLRPCTNDQIPLWVRRRRRALFDVAASGEERQLLCPDLDVTIPYSELDLEGEHLNPSENSSGTHQGEHNKENQPEHNTETVSNDILSSSVDEDADLGLTQLFLDTETSKTGRPLRTPRYLRDYVQ